MKKISLILILITYSISAQVEKDSAAFSPTLYSQKIILSQTDKQLNTYNFYNLFGYNFTFNNFFIGLRENFNSTISNTSTKNIKDEQYFSMLVSYKINQYLTTGSSIKNNLYIDDRNLSINKTMQFNGSLFLKYSPIERIEFSPFAGLSRNDQIGENDNGYVYGSELNIDELPVGEFGLTSHLKILNEDISPRKNNYRLALINLTSNFDQSFENILSGYFNQQRKDFYFSADPVVSELFEIRNNIQSRTETNYYIQDRLRLIQTSSPFALEVNGKVSWRDIERNTRYISIRNLSSFNDSRINELKIDLNVLSEYNSDPLIFAFRVNFSERNEKHQSRKLEGIIESDFINRQQNEFQKNNTSQLVNLAFSSIYNISRNDRIYLSLFHRKLKYDTPSSENYDDRDELLTISKLQYDRIFNPAFKIFASIEASLNKIVYIFSERSSNNNIQRVIKFTGGGRFSNKLISSTNSAEVLANYTVFDYEEFNPNFKSYSFRQFIFRDSTRFNVAQKLKVHINGYLKLSEQGDFKWTSFSNKPQRFINEIFAEPKLSFLMNKFTIACGTRFFLISTYSFNKGVDKTKLTDYKSVGPILELGYESSELLEFYFNAWYEFITAEKNTKRELFNMNLKLKYSL